MRPTELVLTAGLLCLTLGDPRSTVSAQQPPASAPSSTAAEPGQERITLDYRDADLANVLRSLSRTYNLNLVTSTDVKGKVTVSLTDVTIDGALDAILTANGLMHTRRGNIIYINPGAPEAAAMANEPIRLKYLKAADAQNLLRKILSPKGDIKVDEVSNTLVVIDFPGNIDRVQELVHKLDVPPQQVLIEAKIIDITSKDLRNMGVTWTADYKPAGDAKGLFDRGTRAQEQLKATTTLAGTSSSLSGGQFKLDALTFKGLSITATLDALVRDDKAHLLATPSIAVINNQEARIVIGEKVPFKERQQTTTGTTETTKFIDVGTTLRVTPSINADGYITVRIHPEVSSVSALLDAGPRITTREADTTVRIKEGETIVIAGLIKQEDNRTKSGVPILGQLPILDYVFGSRSKDQTQTELAVFITPKIIRSREEEQALSAQAAKKEEAYVTIATTGKLGVVLSLFEKAEQLEQGEGLESRRKPEWFRMQQALNLYEHIAAEYPDSPQAPVALYRAARIYLHDVRDVQQAKLITQHLLERYPDSSVAARAKRFSKEIEKAERLQQRSLDLAQQLAEEKRRQQEQKFQQRQQEELTRQREAQRQKAQEAAELRRKQTQERAEQLKAERLRQQQEQAAQRQKAQEAAGLKKQQAQEHAEQLKAEQLRKQQEQAKQRQQAKELVELKRKEAQEQAERRRQEQERTEQLRAERLRKQQEQAEHLQAERLRKQQELAAQRQQAKELVELKRKEVREKAERLTAERLRAQQEQTERRRQEQELRRQQQEELKRQREAQRQKAQEAEELKKKQARERAEQLKAERLRKQQEQAEHREAERLRRQQELAEQRQKAQETAELRRRQAQEAVELRKKQAQEAAELRTRQAQERAEQAQSERLPQQQEQAERREAERLRRQQELAEQRQKAQEAAELRRRQAKEAAELKEKQARERAEQREVERLGQGGQQAPPRQQQLEPLPSHEQENP